MATYLVTRDVKESQVTVRAEVKQVWKVVVSKDGSPPQDIEHCGTKEEAEASARELQDRLNDRRRFFALRFDPDDHFAAEVCLRQLVDYFNKRDAIPREVWEQAFEDQLARMKDEEDSARDGGLELAAQAVGWPGYRIPQPKGIGHGK